MFDRILLFITLTVIGLTFIKALYLDIKSRKIPLNTWKPAIYIGLPLSVIYTIYYNYLNGFSLTTVVNIIFIGIFLCIIFICNYKNIFGGADAIQLYIIIISNGLIFGFSSLILLIQLMVVLSIGMFIIIFLLNIINKNYKGLDMENWWILLCGEKVHPEQIPQKHGLVMEKVIWDGKSMYIQSKFENKNLKSTKYFSDRYPVLSGLEYDNYKLYGKKIWIMYVFPLIVIISLSYFISVFLQYLFI